MKTIHSVFFIIFILFLQTSSFAFNSWPEVSSPTWDIKDQRLTVCWNADSDMAGIVYCIEKSSDGKHFSTAGIVLGGFQNNQIVEFSYRLKYESGMQYRIKQVNKEGAFRMIDIKSL